MNISWLKSKSTNAQTTYNLIGTIVRTAVSFITMPIFTRVLGAEQYGLYSIYNSWVLILTCIMGLNVNSGLGTGLYKFEKTYKEFKSSTLLEGIAISLVEIAVFLLLFPLTQTLLGYPIIIYVILLIEAIGQFILNFATLSWIYEKRALTNMIVSVLSLFSTTVLSLLLLVFWKKENIPLYYGRVLGAAIPIILISIIYVLYTFREQKPNYNTLYWKYSLSFGIPMVLHQLSQQILSQSDRLMMKFYGVEAAEIGVYSFIYSFVAILGTILGALNNSWCPFLYDELKNRNYDKLNKMVKNYVELFSVLCVGFILLSKEVAKIFGDEQYWSGFPLIPIIALVIFFTFSYQFSVNYEFFMAKPKIVAIGTAFSGVINIILNAIMIPMWGMTGAAVATLISYLALSVMHYLVVHRWKLERYPLSFAPVIKGLVFVTIGCAVFYLFIDLWIVRFLFAALLGVYLVRTIVKRKAVF